MGSKHHFLLLAAILFFTALAVKGQNCPPTPAINFIDSQFEHTPKNADIGTDWTNCGGDPSDQ